MHAVVALDHSDKWRAALKFPSRKSECTWYLPGQQVFFWKRGKAKFGIKRSSRRTDRWIGPAVIIGHEWDGQALRDSYWVSYHGNCYLVASAHLRPAELDERMEQEKYVESVKRGFDEVQQEDFQYQDLRRTVMETEDLEQRRINISVEPAGRSYSHDQSRTSST